MTKILTKISDGGKESNSIGYVLFEIKSFASILLLKFTGKSREVFHEHAFHCLGWVLKGQLNETLIDGRKTTYNPSFKPFFIGRRDFHKVDVDGVAWVFSIRGPWKKSWKEKRPLENNETVVLTHGRNEIARYV